MNSLPQSAQPLRSRRVAHPETIQFGLGLPLTYEYPVRPGVYRLQAIAEDKDDISGIPPVRVFFVVDNRGDLVQHFPAGWTPRTVRAEFLPVDHYYTYSISMDYFAYMHTCAYAVEVEVLEEQHIFFGATGECNVKIVQVDTVTSRDSTATESDDALSSSPRLSR